MSFENLQFVALSSFVQPSFWNKIAEIKINIDKLNENEHELWGIFSNSESTWTTHILEVDSTSFNLTFNSRANIVPFYGKLFNKNTVEQFKDCDKTKLIADVGQQFLDDLKSDKILREPFRLNTFFILSFSDLKKYLFYYWFAFPVPHLLQIKCFSVRPLTAIYTLEQLQNFAEQYQSLEYKQKSFFLIHQNQIFTLESQIKNISEGNYNEYYFVFADFLSTYPRSQLKNLAIFLLHYCPFLGGKNVNFVLLYLDRKLNINQSLIYQLVLPEIDIDKIEWVGWEKNEKNKFAPRLANMKATIDPQVLYEESVDLNLKLMKWRLVPNIDLEIIKNSKCLLLGSGTLGCSVARNLVGWGVRNITLVDNSNVSYSNPVRQILFNYEDAVANKPKAKAAADHLKEIFPSLNSQGFQFTIPMPGHSVGESTLEAVKNSVDQLTNLIKDHDIIFLLTDSRESRWLPTLLGIYNKKIIINVALGFDTYLIMRYGRTQNCGQLCQSEEEGSRKIAGTQLGCYFCNDITAPGNSFKGRTLDQQCTVTRPGVSSIAGALAVELAVSILQHEEKINAPAFYKPSTECPPEQECILGIIPHSIRGFLSYFTHILPATPRFNQCIACSDIVQEEFKKKDFGFLLEAFDSSTYLEELTGLNDLFKNANYSESFDFSFDDED